MSEIVFTILLPVHRPPMLLPYAIASVLAQERQDFELFVICDGAPPETAEAARRYAADDDRIRVFDHPKGERHGEIYRDQALREARGTYVCQIGDDDLWLPNHLGEMATLLAACDFGNLPQVEVTPDGAVEVRPGTLADTGTRALMMTPTFNFFGPTVAGYRLEAYRALPAGWSPAPSDRPTDLFMWQKFLAHDGLRFGTRFAVTTLKFPDWNRHGWPLERRRAEIAAWAARLANPAEHDPIVQTALLQLSQSAHDLARRSKLTDKAAREREARVAELEDQGRQALAALADSAAHRTTLDEQVQQANVALNESATHRTALEEQINQMKAALSDGAARRTALEAQVRQADAALSENTSQLARLAGKLKRMRRSWSWRLTRPFRKLARRLSAGR